MQLFVGLALVGALCLGTPNAEVIRDGDGMAANPIRKVVTLLQGMAKKVEAQIEAGNSQNEEFLCSCKSGTARLQKTIADNTEKLPVVETDLQQSTTSLAKVKEDIATHRTNLDASTKALAAAAGLRNTEKQAFEAESGEKKDFIAGIIKAVPALSGGAAFVQTESALTAILRKATVADTQMTEYDRDSLTSFLSTGTPGAEVSTQEILGMLSNMKSDYEKVLTEITATEAQSVAIFKDLKTAKTQEAQSLRTSINKKNNRAGTLSVNMVNLRHDKKTAEDELAADQKMLQNLASECGAAPAAYEARVKVEKEELSTIHETVQILSNDDALDVFKATLPSSAGSLLQVVRAGTIQQRLRNARAASAILHRSIQHAPARPGLQFLEMALLGKNVDFTKLTKMVDDMISLLGSEQATDDSTQTTCKAQLHAASGKAQALAKSINEQQADKDEREEELQGMDSELKALQDEATQLDTLVADTTKERKAQNTDYTSGMASNQAAKEILQFAQKRLDQFYNPEQSKKAVAFTEQKASIDELTPPSDLFGVLDARRPTISLIAVSTSTTSANGVREMLSKLVNDVDVQMTLAKGDESRAQKAYETIMTDAASKHVTYLKSINIKQAARAETEISSVQEGGELAASQKASAATLAYQQELHKQCDWLLQNMDFRRTARAEELDNLRNAKATLHGANLSLVQKHSLLSRSRHA